MWTVTGEGLVSIAFESCTAVTRVGSVPCPAPKAEWEVPADFKFKVDPDCVRARDSSKAATKFVKKHIKWAYSRNKGFSSNHPRCPYCGAHSRPSILMFGDGQFVTREEEDRAWQAWRSAMLDDLKRHPKKRLIVLELGAGVRITRVRNICETFLQNLGPTKCDLVRINLEHPARGTICSPTFAIKDGALHALQMIDRHLNKPQR